jgi:hypothetical protein
MKKRVDSKQTFAIVLALSFVLLVVVYFFVYKKFEEQATRLTNENNALRSRISELQGYYDDEPNNKQAIASMTDELNTLFNVYPGDTRFEDGIYEALTLYGVSEIEYTNIAFASNTPIKQISADTVVGAGIEKYTEDISFNEFDVTYDGTISYDGLKNFVREVAGGKYNLAIGNMSYSGTDSGDLSGTALIAFYSVSGAGCTYEEVPVATYDVGTSNIFGYINVKSATED